MLPLSQKATNCPCMAIIPYESTEAFLKRIVTTQITKPATSPILPNQQLPTQQKSSTLTPAFLRCQQMNADLNKKILEVNNLLATKAVNLNPKNISAQDLQQLQEASNKMKALLQKQFQQTLQVQQQGQLFAQQLRQTQQAMQAQRAQPRGPERTGGSESRQ